MYRSSVNEILPKIWLFRGLSLRDAVLSRLVGSSFRRLVREDPVEDAGRSRQVSPLVSDVGQELSHQANDTLVG